MLESGDRKRDFVGQLISYTRRLRYIFYSFVAYGLFFSYILAKFSYRVARNVARRIIFYARRVKSKAKNIAYRLINLIRSKFDENHVFAKDSAIIMDILNNEGAEKAVQYLKKSHPYFRLDATKFLIQLYEYAVALEDSKTKYWLNTDIDNKMIIHFCCWGESYSNKAIEHLLPSLLAPGNMPWLSTKYNISLLIHCDDRTKRAIASSSVFKKLERYANVVFHMLPDNLMQLYKSKSRRISNVYPQIRYLLLGVCQTHAFKVGINNQAFLSNLMPDVILSDNFYAHACSKIENKKVVFTITHRTNYKSARRQLDLLSQEGDNGSISVAADKLLVLQIEHIHPFELKRIVSTTTHNFTPSARLTFKTDTGFVFRCFHYPPIVINCQGIDKDTRLDYLPIDNTVLNKVLNAGTPYEHQVWVCTNPSDMAIMELSDENPEVDLILNSSTLSYDQMVSQIQNLLINAPAIYDSPLNRFLATFRHKFQVEGYINPMGDGVESVDDVKFMTDVYQVVSNNRMDLTG